MTAWPQWLIPTGDPSKHARVASLLLSGAEAEVIRASCGRQGEYFPTGYRQYHRLVKSQNIARNPQLSEQGYLVEDGEEASQGGRKARLLRLNDQLGYLVGLDIGATSIDVVLADVSGQVFQRRSEPADVRQAPDDF